MQWITWLVSLAALLGPRMEEAWPYVKHIAEDLMNIAKIVNGGKVLSRSAGPRSNDASNLVNTLRQTGCPEDEVNEVVASLEAAQDRLAG